MQLQNHFLIAMPGLKDFNFSKAVIYVCAHNDEGAMGIVINHPIVEIHLREVLEQMNITVENPKIDHWPVLLGGPIQPERGFIVHPLQSEWQSTLVTSDHIGVTSSQDILRAMAQGQGPAEANVILGYSGWGAGQLEKEVQDNLWLTSPVDEQILFKTPFEDRWQKAVASLGIDVNSLSGDIGHA